MLATGVLGQNYGRNRGTTQSSSSMAANQPKRSSSSTSPNNMGLPFDPYDYNPLPSRIISTGAATNFPSIANLVGDVLNAPVLVPTTQIDSAQITPHRNAPAGGFPARAALGGAYIARWVWGKEKGTPAGTGRGGFEEEIRRLLAKRWAATGGIPMRTSTNAPTTGSKASSTAGSGTSTPYGHNGRSGLGRDVLVEEEEEEAEELDRIGALHSAFALGPGYGDADRLRSLTGSTVLSGSSIGDNPSTVFTTPDLNNSTASPTGDGASSAPATLVPVTAMPTSEPELQLGLAKVADPDVDAFMAYAAIVPEYCRLEGMLVKGVV